MSEHSTDPENTGEGKKEKEQGYLRSSAKYLRELSVVVLGVAITFLVSGWVSNHREKKILRSHLDAVRIELEENLDYIRERVVFYDRLVKFAGYLHSKPVSEHHPDSVWKASYFEEGKSVIEYSSNLAIEKSAFETLKASGTMNLPADQSFMRALVKCYTTLDNARISVDANEERKVTTTLRVFMENRFMGEARINILDPRLEELFIFFASPYRTDQTLQTAINQIERTLSLFPD